MPPPRATGRPLTAHIKDAAAAAPELATQALKGLANQLPAELGAVKSLLTNDAFLTELVSNKELQGSLEKLIGGDTSAIKELLHQRQGPGRGAHRHRQRPRHQGSAREGGPDARGPGRRR